MKNEYIEMIRGEILGLVTSVLENGGDSTSCQLLKVACFMVVNAECDAATIEINKIESINGQADFARTFSTKLLTEIWPITDLVPRAS